MKKSLIGYGFVAGIFLTLFVRSANRSDDDAILVAFNCAVATLILVGVLWACLLVVRVSLELAMQIFNLLRRGLPSAPAPSSFDTLPSPIAADQLPDDRIHKRKDADRV